MAKKKTKHPTPVHIVLIPDAATSKWDNIEVMPMKEHKEHILDEGEVREAGAYCEPCEPGEEDFWSVFLHQVEGGVQCIADLPTERLAYDFANLLQNAVKNFKDNGFLDFTKQFGEG